MLVLLFLASLLVPVSLEACITNPGDPKKTCLDSPIACSIDKCALCSVGQCAQCSNGYYLDFKSKSCKPCFNGCDICSSGEERDCFQIKPAFTISKENKIVPCPGNFCGHCAYPADYRLHPQVMCLECEIGTKQTYVEGSNAVTCEKCEISNCMYCNQDVSECQQCKQDFTLKNGQCVSGANKCNDRGYDGTCYDCPEGQKWSIHQSKCVSCPKQCSACSSPGRCIGCHKGYFLNTETSICHECEVPGCISCLDGIKSCERCVPGMYYDLIRAKCMPCHPTCAICSGSKEEDCIACTTDKRIQHIFFDETDSDLMKHQIEDLRAQFPEIMAHAHWMALNFHPDRESYCLETCRNQSFYKERWIEDLVPSLGHECQPIKILHHLKINKYANMYDQHKKMDEEASEELKKAKTAEKQRHKQINSDILSREASEEIYDEDAFPTTQAAYSATEDEVLSGSGDLR